MNILQPKASAASLLRTGMLALVSLSVAASLAAAPALAQSTQAAPQKSRTAASSQNDAYGAQSSAPHNWTTDQILTATVHQAWILSGKDEANFFEIVKQLAEISARNRNLVLPDSPAAGRRAGAYIKAQAKADHNQLLYDIVDKSVRMTGKPAPAVASTH